DTYLGEVIEKINSHLREGGVKADLTGRPKHYYSIYQKMMVRGREFTDIHDLVGIRVLVDTERDCYATLGVIHANWQPVPGRFKDYIAMPKFNMYQSLHTTVIGPGGKPVELQIRTQPMHRTAEYGIAAHWKYKEVKNPTSSWIRCGTTWARARFTSSRRRAMSSRCRPGPPRWTSRTRCTPRSGTAASVPGSTASLSPWKAGSTTATP